MPVKKPDPAKIRNALMLIRTLILRLERDTDKQIDLIVKEVEKLEGGELPQN